MEYYFCSKLFDKEFESKVREFCKERCEKRGGSLVSIKMGYCFDFDFPFVMQKATAIIK